MLHYGDSSRDDRAVEWFEDPRCTNADTLLVLEDGRVVEHAANKPATAEYRESLAIRISGGRLSLNVV